MHFKNHEGTIYIDSSLEDAANLVSIAVRRYINEKVYNHDGIIILCIGTDRATGDSLGPLIGYKLNNSGICGVNVFGTLDEPVHAKNLTEYVKEIYTAYKKPFIIAIDACLGIESHIGYITVNEGAIRPGAAYNKNLMPVGDISVTGIVNLRGSYETALIHNTRLNIVMKLADVVSEGLISCLKADIVNVNIV